MSDSGSDSAPHLTQQVRWVGLCTLLSRLLGLVRDSVMAARFGNGVWLDAFTVAFRIPNLARALLGEGALATAFLPGYLSARATEGPQAANRLAVCVLLGLSLTVGSLLLLGEILLLLVGWWWPLSPESELLRQLTMWLLPYLAMICTAAQLGALLNAEGRFVLPALMPSVLNTAWLLGLWFSGAWTSPHRQLRVMCIAILLGGIGQVALPIWTLSRLGLRFDAQWRRALPAAMRIARQLLPALAALMVTQVNVLMDSLIAWGFTSPVSLTDVATASANSTISFPVTMNIWPRSYPLESGTASALYFGQRLYQFPLGVFGVALGTVLFPRLAAHAQSHSYRLLREDLSLGLRYIAAIGLPASFGLVLIARPLASLFFEYGQFTASNADLTARIIAAYGSGVWAFCGLQILHRAFFAIGDRGTPLRVSLVAVCLNLMLNLSLIWWLGGVGLAVTTSLVSGLQCVTVAMLFRQKVGGWSGSAVGRAVLAAAIGCAALWVVGSLALASVADWPGMGGRLARVVAPAICGSVAYLVTCTALGFSDPWDILWRRRSQADSATA